MKKKILWGFLLPSLISLCVCCKNQTHEANNSPTLFADFYVRYLHDEKLTKAEVSFREGESDSTAVSKDFDEVLFFGRQMEARDWGPEKGILFSTEFTENYPGEYFFQFGDDNAEKRKFSLKMAPLTGYAFQGPVSKLSGANLTLEGELPGEGEKLILLFSNEENKTGAVEIPDIAGKKSFNIKPQALISLSSGKNLVYLVKKKLEFSTENGINASALIEYYSTSQTVEVLE